MVSEEDVVALVVEGHHASALELWVVREQTGEHAGHGVAQAGVEVVENDLRTVVGGLAHAFDVFAEAQRVDLEVGGRAFGQMADQKCA